MGSKLIKLADDTLVEVEVQDAEACEISDRAAESVTSTFDKVKPILLKACRPITEVWKELNKDMQVAEAEVEIGFSFEGQGNIYITKAKAASNFKVKLLLKSKGEET